MNLLNNINGFLKEFKAIMLMLNFFLISGATFASDINPVSIDLYASSQQENSLVVSTVLTNRSSKALYLLKWGTPFEETLGADIFDVQYNNQSVKYIGRLYNRGEYKDKDFILIQAGESIESSIDLYDNYQINKNGLYSISYKGQIHYRPAVFIKGESFALQRAEPTGTDTEIYFNATFERKISYDLPPGFTNCSIEQSEIVSRAQDFASDMAQVASDAMNNASVPTIGQRYVQWFGAADVTRHNTVKTNLNNIFNVFETKKINYSCKNACDGGAVAYVFSASPYSIYLCSPFWEQAETGKDSMAGIIIHELSHFSVVAGARDVTYGYNSSIGIALQRPDDAIRGADNYKYFAENTPFITMDDAVPIVDDYGDSIADAYPISFNTHLTIQGQIGEITDKDFFAFNISAPGRLKIYTTEYKVDTIGMLYDENGTLIADNDDYDNDPNFGLFLDVNPSQYYLSVEPGVIIVGNYRLHFEFVPRVNIPVINYLLD